LTAHKFVKLFDAKHAPQEPRYCCTRKQLRCRIRFARCP
jgi:hypothetical protein